MEHGLLPTFRELAEFFLDQRANSSRWNRANPGLLPPNVSIVSAERGAASLGSGRVGGDSVTFALVVVPSLMNSAGMLHGGAQATLIDTLTTTALSAAEVHEQLLGRGGLGGGGGGATAGSDELTLSASATVTLSVEYLSGGKPGQTVFVRAVVDRAGKALAFLSAELFNLPSDNTDGDGGRAGAGSGDGGPRTGRANRTLLSRGTHVKSMARSRKVPAGGFLSAIAKRRTAPSPRL